MLRYLVLLCFVLPTAVAAQSRHFTAQVVRTIPVIEYQTTTTQNCVTETVTPQKDGSGALVGAVVGGVIGSQISGRDDKVMGAGLGAIGGAIVGDQAQGRAQTQQRCTPVPTTQLVTVGYDVTWTWQGITVIQRMNRDPGATVNLTVQAH